MKVEGREGEGVEGPAEHWWLPQPWKPGGQLPAGSAGLLLVRHDGGDAYQELEARMVLQLMLKVEMKMKSKSTQGAAWRQRRLPS